MAHGRIGNFLCRLTACALVTLAAAGCLTSRRYFQVISHPEGATILVDDEPRGQTNMERLAVDLGSGDHVTIRVEKEGYQPAGAILSRSSPPQVAFFLEEVPGTRTVLAALRELQRAVDRISRNLEQDETEKEP